ncbi:unnamed protein product [Urochloa humidicola]
MSVQGLRDATGLGADAGRNQARSLVRLGVVKEVQDVRRNRRRNKLYMAAEFTPSDEVSGGAWYHEGRVDKHAVAAARRRCLAQVRRHGGVASAEMIHAGVGRDEPAGAAGFDMGGVEDILRTMVLDRSLEEVTSTGEGEFAAVGRGTMCYREPGKMQPEGMMEGIPCGVCPMIDDCSPEGVISPGTCVYYQKWLQMDFCLSLSIVHCQFCDGVAWKIQLHAVDWKIQAVCLHCDWIAKSSITIARSSDRAGYAMYSYLILLLT